VGGGGWRLTSSSEMMTSATTTPAMTQGKMERGSLPEFVQSGCSDLATG
jgi:hypothetical protein